MVRIHSPRPIPSITCRDWKTKQPTQLPTQFQSCCRIRSLLYCGHGEERGHASLTGPFFRQSTRRFPPRTRRVREKINIEIQDCAFDGSEMACECPSALHFFHDAGAAAASDGIPRMGILCFRPREHWPTLRRPRLRVRRPVGSGRAMRTRLDTEDGFRRLRTRSVMHQRRSSRSLRI